MPFGLGAAGAAWVFTRSAGVWTQQGNKLVGTGAPAKARPSRCPPTATSPSWAGLPTMGASGALVFTRSGGHWTQEKNLVGTGAVGKSAPSVALSADGSIVMVGGSNDNGGIGAAWVFTRSGGDWTQDKNLVGTGAVGKSAPSVALSADSTIMVGRSNDNGGVGAASVFTRSGDGSDSQEPPRPSAPSNQAVEE